MNNALASERSIENALSLSPLHGSRRRQAAYAVMLVLGLVLPLKQFTPWLEKHGIDLPRLGQDLFANRVSSFFAWDVFAAVATLLVVAFADQELSRAQRWLVVAGSLLGASVGLPLYLFLREGNRCRIIR